MPPDGDSDCIYHLALRDDWEHALKTEGGYRVSTLRKSLDEEGFIHCSFAHQVQGIADRFYKSRNDVVLLRIDASLVDADIVVENLEGGDELFPHIYGELTLDAVIGATDVPVDADGRLIAEPLLGKP